MHVLLQRQLRRLDPLEGDGRQEAFLKIISQTYDEYDHQLHLQDHAAQLMSDELNELNAALRKERDEKVAESQKRFELAVEGASDGIWDWNVAEDNLWMSGRTASMLGHSDTKPKEGCIADWYALVSEDDVHAAKAFIARHLRGEADNGVILRFSHVSGEARHMMCRAFAVYDAAGGAVRLVGVLTDISGLIAMQEDLRNARDAAQKACEAKSEFLSNMSHELRTPMHAVLSYAKMGFTFIENTESSTLETYFRNIHTAGSRLLGLLNTLLNLSKLETGTMAYNKAREDFTSIIEHAIIDTNPLTKDKSITVTSEITSDDVVAVLDKRCMIQVMVNLISNAITFSPAGGEICVRLSNGQLPNRVEALRCTVADEGPGIPEAELEAIFDKFTQSSKTKSGAGGTGLGLAICREIVEAHGGRIWAENRTPKGAVLSLVIPREVSSFEI